MISLAHRTVFVHIPKCGGQSIEDAFCRDLGLSWHDHRALLLMHERPTAPRWKGSVPRLAHLPASEYVTEGYLPKALWKSFFTFATVRNPFARLESQFFYRGKRDTSDFEEFITSVVPSRIDNMMYRRQMRFLTAPPNGVIVEKVFRLEDLDTAWDEIQERSGVTQDLPHRNKSTREPLEWTDAMRDLVRKTYASDFARLGYDAETGAPLSRKVRFEQTKTAT